MTDKQLKEKIGECLAGFQGKPLGKSAADLFNILGYRSDRRIGLTPNTAGTFVSTFADDKPFNAEKALLGEWETVDFLFQITGEDIGAALQHRLDFETNRTVDNAVMESYLFFAISLRKEEYTRTQLSTITREVNKLFPMPALVLFKHGRTLTLSIIDRRLNKQEQSKDVLEKVTLIKDIAFPQPHRAHIEILFDLSIEALREKHGFANFVALHQAWRKTLDASELNKRFFQEVANWYFWASQHIVFPQPKDVPDAQVYQAQAVIRLITRLIFCWFLKEKGLIPAELFNPDRVRSLLKLPAGKADLNGEQTTYYKAVLQNLFFATLNQEMGKRAFRREGQNFMVPTLYRYRSLLEDPDKLLGLLSGIPFLNGGLFECLDIDKGTREQPAYIRIDGFSDRDDNPLKVPDFLFFSPEHEVDLSSAYGETRYRRARVRGLVHIFDRYKFTVHENTPIEQEVALDPELLGQVFENLLAAYNPETRVTARKQTGSFYTPREIVGYMVDEALIAHLEGQLKKRLPSLKDMESLSELLREVLAYTEKDHPFNEEEVAALIDAIDNMKVLDPACGSGAFPMGILHKLVFILGKLDPRNKRWKAKQIAKAEEFSDSTVKDKAIADIEEAFSRNELDYGRKLYLIEKCLYGVDIQPIAVQIAKLRFFISLVVDQRVDRQAENLGILPLPNLETNLVAANTLVGIAKPKQFKLRNPEIDAKEAELKRVRERHFNARTPATKRRCREEDARLRAEISGLLGADGLLPHEVTERLARWDPYDQNASADFFDAEWMFGVSQGFDVVIANPPYIKEYVNREAFDGLRDSSYYQGKMDIWYLFACQGIDHLKDRGVLTFIAQSNWVTSYGASKLRNKVISDTEILALLDFGDYKIFESSDIQTMVMVFKKGRVADGYRFDYRRIMGDTPNFEDVLDLLNRGGNPDILYLTPEIQRHKSTNTTLTFSHSATEKIIGVMRSKANLWLNESEVANGIHHHHDIVNRERLRILGDGFEVGDGIFVLSDEEKRNVPFLRSELALLKPSYTTKELHKWYGDPKNREWVIYTDSSFKHPENVKPYPNIKAHLDKFKDVITSDNWPYGLHRARDERFFKGEKIVAVRKCAEPTFAYTDFDCYVSATFYVIKTERIDLKYLTAVLNSNLIAFWLRNKGKMQGNNYQIDKEPLLAIPIFKPSCQEQDPIVTLVDQIILATKRGDYTSNSAKQAKIKELELQIDQLVYQLYGLTREEIALVEGSTCAN